MNKLYIYGDDDKSNGMAYIKFLTISRNKGCSTKAGVSRGNFPVFSLAGAKRMRGNHLSWGSQALVTETDKWETFIVDRISAIFRGFCFEAVDLFSRAITF